MSTHPSARIRIGISSCLLGTPVRYDGNHKLDNYITGTLSTVFEFVAVCPEVAIGLGVPREPLRLVGAADAPRAVGIDSGVDVTAKLSAYGERQARTLGDISGYILKSKSPSCGMERVRVYGTAGGPPRKAAQGIYARALTRAQPLLPVEEEGRLGDPRLRDNFIERVLAYHRWQQLVGSRLSVAKLLDFHAVHKLVLLAHSPTHYRSLGRLAAGANKQNLKSVAESYIGDFMEALRKQATPARHANVLLHLLGYLKQTLDAADKAELVEAIHGYRRGEVPLLVPVTLLRHHFRKHPDPYVDRQVYLDPRPPALRTR
jgi:uncharacterized protein YbgA (DUF1722 family)/uncharacterized protein YbbK (DUF523 family)